MRSDAELRLDGRVMLQAGVRLALYSGPVQLAEHVAIHDHVQPTITGGTIRLGPHSWLDREVNPDAAELIDIGVHTVLGARTSVVDPNHRHGGSEATRSSWTRPWASPRYASAATPWRQRHHPAWSKRRTDAVVTGGALIHRGGQQSVCQRAGVPNLPRSRLRAHGGPQVRDAP